MSYAFSRLAEERFITSERPESLFVTSASFESRCTYATTRLLPEYCSRNYVIVRYVQNEREANDISKARKANFEIMYAALKEHCRAYGGELEVLNCDKEEPLDGYLDFLDVLERLESRYGRPLDITLDISTFTKQYILVLFKALYSVGAHVRVLYTGAENYPKQLTWGVKSIVSVPFHNGYQLSKNPTVLALFLGYERDRSMAIWKACDPAITISIVSQGGQGGSKQSTVATRQNLDLIRTSDSEIRIIDRFDINQTVTLLGELAETYPRDKYNLVVSPLSTKVQAMGIAIFFQEFLKRTGHSPFSVLYAVPFDYAKDYSKGPLSLWQYDIGYVRAQNKESMVADA
jgi:hypothetical protein